MSIPIFSYIEKLITEHGSSTILGEHLALFKSKFSILKDEFSKIEAENAVLRERVAELEQKISALPSAKDGFEELDGVLFKRRVQGGYHNVPYCSTCHKPMSPFPPGEAFHCTACGYFTAFTEAELSNVMENLP